ncbi:MAG: YfiR family protein [Acidobacteriota bacterium]
MALLTTTTPRHLVAAALGLLLLLPAGLSARAGVQGGADEYQVKAAFLYQFTRFVEWPADAFADRKAPVVLCLAGTDPFGDLLDGQLAGKTAGERPFRIVRLAAGAPPACHILFVGASERERTARWLDAHAGRPVLTIGDMSGFARDGGVANFVVESSRVRFEFNTAAADRARLKVSSKLLALARVVQPEPAR